MAVGNHNLDAKLYYYLFNRMDDDSVAGTLHRVSRGRIALDLSEKGGQGKRKQLITFTANDVDVALLRLERAGLIRRVSDDANLMIKFSGWIEDARSFTQNEVPNHVPNKYGTSHEAKTFIKQDSYATSQVGSSDDVPMEVPTIITTTTTMGMPFVMTLDWKPSNQFGKRLDVHGIKPEQVFTGWVGEFSSYWQTQPQVRLTQDKWEHKLVQNIISRLKNPNIGTSAKALKVVPPKPTSTGQGAAVVPFKRASVPNTYDASELQHWALKNGFRAAKVGESIDQYKLALRKLAEMQYQDRERGVSNGNG